MLGPTLDGFLKTRHLTAVCTARQGAAIEVTYQGVLKAKAAADNLVAALNQLDGVQSVSLKANGETLDAGE